MKGTWKQVGEKGHTKFKQFDEKEFKQSQTLQDGSGPFAAEAIQTQKTMLMEGFSAVEKARKEKALPRRSTPALKDILDILHKQNALGAGDMVDQSQDALGAGATAKTQVSESESISSGDDGDSDKDFGLFLRACSIVVV